MKHSLRKKLYFGLAVSLLTPACNLTINNVGNGSNSEGRTVTVLGVIVTEQQAKFEAALAPFEEETGIDVIYEGTDALNTLLPVRVESGNAPDLAMLASPSLMANFAEAGQLTPVTAFIDRATLTAAYPDTWLSLGSVNETLYGIPYRALVKSLVWFSPTAFAAQGYEIPATWDEMMTLSDQIVADGGTPWCIGLESGNATGWPGSDWVEEILLRTAGPEVYDQWVAHEIPFDNVHVRTAFETFGNVVLTSNYVAGGAMGSISMPFGDSPLGLFNDPPDCYLHRQGDFIASFFPEDIQLGEDVDVFLLPGINAEFGVPVLVAGDMVVMFNDTPEARALMEYLVTPTSHEIWAQAGGFLSPHLAVDSEFYPDPVSQKAAEFLTQAETVRFDGSDMMPSVVGTGTFWSGIVDYLAGTPVDEVLSNIEASWPE